MMKKFLLAIVIILVIWIGWIQIGYQSDWNAPEAFLEVTDTVWAYDECNSNIVAMQPYMLSKDYQSEKHFYEKLKLYFEAAKKANQFGDKTVVLLPEYLGTWLVVNDEKTSVTNASSITGAMAIMVLSNPFRFAKTFFIHQNESDRVASTIFRMKAEAMANVYAKTFKTLAKDYGVTINAGSIVLPAPRVVQNEIEVNVTQPIYNSTFIFYPDGTIDEKITRKSYPISSEMPFVTPYPMEELPLYELSVGKTVLLVCADSWYPESYDRIRELEPSVVLVNSYCAGDNTMNNMWRGYDGGNTPSDVDTTDIGKTKEVDAWKKYAMPTRLYSTQTSYAVNVFLRGELWDLGADGQPFIYHRGELQPIKSSAKAGIWNFCF